MFTLSRSTIEYGCISLVTLGCVCGLVDWSMLVSLESREYHRLNSYGYTGLMTDGSDQSSIIGIRVPLS